MSGIGRAGASVAERYVKAVLVVKIVHAGFMSVTLYKGILMVVYVIISRRARMNEINFRMTSCFYSELNESAILDYSYVGKHAQG